MIKAPRGSRFIGSAAHGRPGFRVETSQEIDARYVVAATGPFQNPVIPKIVPDKAGVDQLHSSGYRNRIN